MPAIKKKWMQTNMEDNSEKNASFEEEDKEPSNPDDATVAVTPVKRPVPTGPGMLKGLDGEVLEEKRKRFTPPAELKLSEWLDNNLEKRTEETIHLPLLYKYYTELCQANGSDILDVPVFNRMVKTKFGNSFGVQASSIYKSVIKERKMGVKKKSSGGIKLKEIIIDAINHFGNPFQGVRFFGLKQYIATRCPALQIDTKPKILRRALEMGTNFGYVELTKGIGMMGSYRLPGAVEPPPKAKAKPKKEEETENEDGEGKEGEEDSSSSKEGKEGEDKAGGDAEKEAGDGETTKEEADAAVAKPKKPKKVPTWSYSKISYSNPTKVEDTFPLAITYQSAPKAAGLARIRRYILEKYGEELSDSRWRKCLDHGIDKGYWEHISGSGMSGRIHLLMDDFDPNSEQLEDRICAAIIACHDPKSASATQIKKYVTRYHPEFGVDSKPDKFKKALIRAVEKKMIRQLSGLGASGTFMLVVPFTPSPTVLAGDDDSEDEVEEEDYTSTYVPKGTKSRGMPKVKTMEVVTSQRKPNKTSTSSTSPRRSASKQTASNSRDKKKLVASPVAKRNKAGSGKKGRNVNKKKNARRSLSPLTDEEEEEEDMVEYSPRKSQSRGGGGRSGGRDLTPSSSKAKSSAKKGGRAASSGRRSSPSKKNGSRSSSQKSRNTDVVLSDIDDDDDVNASSAVEYTPRKSASRGGGKGDGSRSKSKQNGTPKSQKKRKVDSDLDDGGDDNDEGEDDGAEYTPRKSASRGGVGKTESAKSKSLKKRKVESDLDDGGDDNDEGEDDVEYTPRKSSSRGGVGKAESAKSLKKRKATGDSDDDGGDDNGDDDDNYKSSKSASRGKAGSGKKKSRR